MNNQTASQRAKAKYYAKNTDKWRQYGRDYYNRNRQEILAKKRAQYKLRTAKSKQAKNSVNALDDGQDALNTP